MVSPVRQHTLGWARRSYLEKRFIRSKEQQRKPLSGSTTGRHPFLRHQSVFCATILTSHELTRLGLSEATGMGGCLVPNPTNHELREIETFLAFKCISESGLGVSLGDTFNRHDLIFHPGTCSRIPANVAQAEGFSANVPRGQHESITADRNLANG